VRVIRLARRGCLLLLAGVFAVGLFLILTGRFGPAPAAPAGESVFVDGVRWHIVERGQGSTVILVHGFLSSSFTWHRVLDALANHHHVIAVDLPGFGYSERPARFDYSAPGEAAALLRFLAVRKLEKVTLVGNSMGGAIAMLVAAASPGRVSGVVLVDSATPWTRPILLYRILRLPAAGETAMILLRKPAVAWMLKNRLYADPSRVTDKVIEGWYRPLRLAGTARAALGLIRTRASGYERLPSMIRCRALVIWGAEDRMVPVPDGVRLARELRDATLVVLPATGHLPQEESPGEFLRAVEPFLR
jgi:pimeloyl-ACP methyl ester carboxylesterase